MTLRVLHLAGSAVSDFYADLSRLYAQDCLQATANSARYEFVVAYVSPDRRWCFPTDLTRRAIAAAPSMTLADALQQLAALRIDVMVPQMFCLPGMTSYRALFDVLGIPYLGNPPDVMSLGANKARAKAVVAAAGVAVPAGEVLRPGDQLPTASALVPPFVVKPVDADNSLGVSLVRDEAGLEVALKSALEQSELALVESYVELGREVRCGVVVRDGDLVCLPIEEYNVDTDTKPIRGVQDKISAGVDGELTLVAKDASKAWIVDPADPVTARVWEAARRCHVALGARHYSLFDFRVDPEGTPWFLEAGLYCSFAAKSVVSVMARAAGIGTDELFAMVIDQTMAEHAAR